MKCRSFERQAADWLSGRLSPERSEEMAAHEKTCASCARIAAAEGDLRERWQAGTEAFPSADLWPRLALRLEAEEQSRDERPQRREFALRGIFQKPRWAMAALLALATLGVCQWNRPPVDRGNIERSASVRTTIVPVQSHADSWSALGSTAQEDPAVDDPVGSNMENVWTYLKTDLK